LRGLAAHPRQRGRQAIGQADAAVFVLDAVGVELVVFAEERGRRNLARAVDARATIGKIAAKAAAIEFMAADLNSDAGWANADYVVHVASPLPAVNPKSDDELVRAARNGALRVLKASRDAGVKRVVMTSAMAAIAYGRGERVEPFSEADWTDETNRNDTSAYERSKTIAERAAWAWHKAEGGGLFWPGQGIRRGCRAPPFDFL